MRIKHVLFFIFFVSLLVIAGCINSKNTPVGNAVLESDDGDYVKIPVDSINQLMTKYTFDANGIDVTYFAVKDRDGMIRTAFDACDVCGGYKGYTQVGEDVRCKNCGRMFKITDLGTKNKGGGCWPSYLSHAIEDDYIVISKDEIGAGSFRFA